MATPRHILADFYKNNRLPPDGGIHSPHVKIEMGKRFHFYFPNFPARRKAVLKHDIHHLVTGYSAASLLGESEISAWEIGSGCKKYHAAFFIDLSGMMLPMAFHFRSVFRAYIRGRRTKNLYHDLVDNEQALDMELEELKTLLMLDRYGKRPKAKMSDYLSFAGITLAGFIYSVLLLPLLPFVVMYSLYVTFTAQPKRATEEQLPHP